MDDSLRRQFDAERDSRIRAEIGLNDSAEAEFLAAMSNKFSPNEASIVMDALQFSKTIDYSHHGLSNRAYLNHPLRVATYVLREMPRPSYETTIVGLLHNVLEVSDVTAGELIARYGCEISAAIEILTIDRSRSDQEYKNQYYKKIKNGPAGASVVKILDKLDNVFMICFNPSDNVRSVYLDEIERMVLPLTLKVLPRLHGYFSALTGYMKDLAYLDKQEVVKSLVN